MATSTKSSKEMKLSKDGIDRITNLPEALLSKILSLLPTKNAVATSVLSRKWKLLWTSISTLNFHEHISPDSPKEQINMKRDKFTIFVGRMLMLIGPSYIQKFSLFSIYKLIDPLHFILWITVIAPTVRELNLDLIPSDDNESIEMQLNHFRFNNLVVLRLEGCGLDLKIPANTSIYMPNLQKLRLIQTKCEIGSNSSICFPKLKFLHLDFVEYRNEDSVHKILSSCPVLERLIIETKDWHTMSCLVICIPSLKKLKVYFSSWPDRVRVYEIQIHKLRKLRLLTLTGYALEAVLNSPVNISSHWRHLKKLTLQVRNCREWCLIIKNLLGSMENLEHIVLTKSKVDKCTCSNNSWWTEPLKVPECLVSRVTTISFNHTPKDCHDELELLSYFLKNANVLQELKLGTKCNNSERKLQLMEKISMLPKGSQACQLKFN